MNSTKLEGWQFNDNSRSSWDIVWTCLTTIFTCTWTVLHQGVPARNKSQALITAAKLWNFVFNFLAPEAIALSATEDLWRVRSLRDRCNAAQESSDRKTHEPDSWLYSRTKPLVEAQNVNGLDLYAPRMEWSLPQCWVVQMGGLTLETEDEWIFYVLRDQICCFIEAGIIKSCEFTDQEIENRAKADALAKAFTVCQSLWVTVNIIGRAQYGLSITPFEFMTLAYIVCAILLYAVWWDKPQDMTVPISIRVPYTRSSLPQEIRSLTDACPRRWMHRRVIPPRQSVGGSILSMGKKIETAAVDMPNQINRSWRGFSLRDETIVNTVAVFHGLLFCGVHVGAWNFAFPTSAEMIAWRVFSLTGLAMLVIYYILGQAPLTARWLKTRGFPLPAYLGNYVDPLGTYTWSETILPLWIVLFYIIARFGMIALVLSSLRALPSDAYIAVDWLASIPHI
ncbi:uncharacterized protein BDW70DRAFT_166870 [Aspergillus foveolatus]|uniref:uncharacterized protein n=1 Tax=Aspergillus foveolatus TaxID=210207 RepID=UPI003CCE39BC